MQIMPATARHLNLPPERIFEAAPNMEAAARYIRELHRRRIPERGIGMPDMRTIVVQGTHAKISEKSTSG